MPSDSIVTVLVTLIPLQFQKYVMSANGHSQETDKILKCGDKMANQNYSIYLVCLIVSL